MWTFWSPSDWSFLFLGGVFYQRFRSVDCAVAFNTLFRLEHKNRVLRQFQKTFSYDKRCWSSIWLQWATFVNKNRNMWTILATFWNRLAQPMKSSNWLVPRAALDLQVAKAVSEKGADLEGRRRKWPKNQPTTWSWSNAIRPLTIRWRQSFLQRQTLRRRKFHSRWRNRPKINKKSYHCNLIIIIPPTDLKDTLLNQIWLSYRIY